MGVACQIKRERVTSAKKHFAERQINFLKLLVSCPTGDPSIVLRMKEDQDGAEPNSNSVSSLNLVRLHQLLPDYPNPSGGGFIDRAKQTIATFQETLAR